MPIPFWRGYLGLVTTRVFVFSNEVRLSVCPYVCQFVSMPTYLSVLEISG